MLKLLNLRITGLLIAGFATLAAVLALAVGYTSFTLSGVSQNVDRMVNLRTPVSIQSTQMVGNLYSTLAILRGYLLTGNPQGKLDRAGVWKELDATFAEFDKMAERFTNPENKRKWADAKALLVPPRRICRSDRLHARRLPGDQAADDRSGAKSPVDVLEITK